MVAAQFFDRDEILRTWHIFRLPGEVLELRIPGAGKSRTISGYFDDAQKLAGAVAEFADNGFPGIFFTINPTNPDLLARAANQCKEYAKSTTSDADIIAIHWLPIDCDPQRPSGISSTDAEHEAAISRAREVRRWLIDDLGWPADAFVLADSGNGAHLTVRIDLENSKDGVDLVKHCLNALDFLFSDDAVKIDVTTYNPSRIWKLYGTMARKGLDMPDRPHRLAKILEAPVETVVVDRGQLEKLAAICSRKPMASKTYGGSQNGAGFDPVAFCKAHGLAVNRVKAWEGGNLAVLEECIFNHDHHQSAFIGGWPDGTRTYRCLHNSCSDKHWRDAKVALGVVEDDPTEDLKRAPWGTREDGADDGKKSATSRDKISTATVLVQLVISAHAELWHDEAKDLYISFMNNGHRETHPIRSKAAKMWLGKLFYDQCGKAPNSQGISDALVTLESMAYYDGPEHEVFCRVGEHDGKIYVDIGDSTWRAIEISVDGWRIIDGAPIRFYRTKTMLPLAIPERGGRWDDLRGITNLSSDRAWILTIAWGVQAFWPHGPYSHLDLGGEQGSGKSLLARILKMLLDPSKTLARRPPKEEKDLMIAAKNERIPSFDNLSGMPEHLSDAFCGLSTGVALACRALYTDSEETFMAAMRPCLMNGIDMLSNRGDLLDRTIIVDLPRIEPNNRREEKEIMAEFERVKPKLLGLFLDATVMGLQRIGDVTIHDLPRMADFCEWVVACEPALPWCSGEFLAEYREAIQDIQGTVVDSDQVARAVYDFALLNAQNGHCFSGTATELLERINAMKCIYPGREPKGWPKSATWFATRLKRVAPAMRARGIKIEWLKPDRNTKIIEISLLEFDSADVETQRDGNTKIASHAQTWLADCVETGDAIDAILPSSSVGPEKRDKGKTRLEDKGKIASIASPVSEPSLHSDYVETQLQKNASPANKLRLQPYPPSDYLQNDESLVEKDNRDGKNYNISHHISCSGDVKKQTIRDSPEFQQFKDAMGKRKCLLCGRSFPYDLTRYDVGDKHGYVCTTCHMCGAPATQKPNPQTTWVVVYESPHDAASGVRR